MPTQSDMPGLLALFSSALAGLAAFLAGRWWALRRERQVQTKVWEDREVQLRAQFQDELDRLRQDHSQLDAKIKKLQEIRRRSDDIFRHMRQGVLLLNGDLEVEWSNPAARRLTHRTSIQILGLSLDRLEWTSGVPLLSTGSTAPSPWKQCLESGSPVDPVEWSLSLEGRKIWLELYCFPAYDPEGRNHQVVVILEDVTRQVEARNEILRLQSAHLASSSDLPLAKPGSSGSSRTPATRPTSHPPMAGTSDGSGVRVLLVEDNPVNQAVAMGILRKLGLELEMAADGQQALDCLARSTFQLVFMDCQMPVMDGYEATRRIRDPSSSVRDHSIPIVAVTANALKGDREKCLECGMDDYLPKPVTRDGFEQVLVRWIPGWSPAAISTFPPDLEDSPSQAPPTSQREVFDRAALIRRLLGQEDLLGTLLGMFFQDAPVQLAELVDAVAAADWENGQRLAHGLKGTLANLEARAAAQAASVVEHACRNGNGHVAQEGMTDLREEMTLAQEAMRASLAAG